MRIIRREIIMSKFKINYFFEKDFKVSHTIEVETISEAIQEAKDQQGPIEFTGEDNVFYKFDTKDIKLVTITEA
jgi:ribosome maturation factor RimP